MSLAEDWLTEQELEGIPANTIAARRRVLRSLGPFTGDDPASATREQVEDWWRCRRSLAPATRSADLAAVRAFFRWLDLWEHRADDPTRRLSSPKVPAGLPRPISREDLTRLLGALEPDLRRAACLGAWAGLRVSEAAALDWGDVDEESRRARIWGKGSKERIVAFSPVLLDSLLPNTGGNVVTAGGEVFTAQRLQRRINRRIQSILGDDTTFHQLRHRYGTIAYQATGDLLAVGRQMGHTSPVTTAVYAAASDTVADQIAEAVAR